MSTSDVDDFVHDYRLTDQLADFSPCDLSIHLSRVTRLSADPTAFSSAGGRWAPPPIGRLVVPALYTSFDGDCALAEVSSYLDEQVPRPTKPVMLHRLKVTASRALSLTEDDLSSLGVDMPRYHERDYPPLRPGNISKTQEIGAAANFLGFDALIVPSARWDGRNVVLLADNHSLDETLEAVSNEQVEWVDWLEENRDKLRAG